MSVAQTADTASVDRTIRELAGRLNKARSRYFWRGFLNIIFPNPFWKPKTPSQYVQKEFHPLLSESLINRWEEMDTLAEQGDSESFERFLDHWEASCHRALDVEQAGIRALYQAAMRGALAAFTCHITVLAGLVLSVLR